MLKDAKKLRCSQNNSITGKKLKLNINFKIYLLIFGCTESSLPCDGCSSQGLLLVVVRRLQAGALVVVHRA